MTPSQADRRPAETRSRAPGGEQWAALLAWRKAHRFHPHQIRHSAATKLRQRYGLETAQAVLGHSTLTSTQVYAERNAALADRAMSEVGVRGEGGRAGTREIFRFIRLMRR